MPSPSPKVIYLAGPMRGLPYFNFPAFKAAREKLRAQGHTVFCPAENDIRRHGHDFSPDCPTGDVSEIGKSINFTIEQAIYEDLRFISIGGCTTIALLPGLGGSTAAEPAVLSSPSPNSSSASSCTSNRMWVMRKPTQRARSLKTPPAEKIAAAPPVRQRLLEGDSAYRKEFAITSGLIDYFPDACAAVAQVSYFGNEKHNPGEPMHHARGKSMDHADCIARHLVERGGFDVITVNGVERQVRHSAALAWRAMALCQEEIEREFGLGCPRGASALPSR